MLSEVTCLLAIQTSIGYCHKPQSRVSWFDRLEWWTSLWCPQSISTACSILGCIHTCGSQGCMIDYQRQQLDETFQGWSSERLHDLPHGLIGFPKVISGQGTRGMSSLNCWTGWHLGSVDSSMMQLLQGGLSKVKPKMLLISCPQRLPTQMQLPN